MASLSRGQEAKLWSELVNVSTVLHCRRLVAELAWCKEITRVKLRCTGTLYDPKSVTVMRAVIGVLEVVEEHNRLAEEAGQHPSSAPRQSKGKTSTVAACTCRAVALHGRILVIAVGALCAERSMGSRRGSRQESNCGRRQWQSAWQDSFCSNGVARLPVSNQKSVGNVAGGGAAKASDRWKLHA